MTAVLCFSVRFLTPSSMFHGIRDGGESEWPPSPARFFQALVSSFAESFRDVQVKQCATHSLKWLQSQDDPKIIAPDYSVGTPFRIAVPNNDLDVVASAWSNGVEPTKKPDKLKVMKLVHTVHLRGADDSNNVVRYLYGVPSDDCPHFDILRAAARSITHLGWGIDMVAGDAELLSETQVAQLTGEVWLPTADNSGTALRVATAGTLDALLERHERFLHRLEDGGFKPVPPLATFRVVGYRRASDPAPRAYTAFSLLKPDASGNQSFDPLRRTRDVAGMIRHAIASAAADQGWSEERVNVFVHGKTPDGDRPSSGAISPDRLQYLPLPTINPLRVDTIRRVLVAAPAQCGREIAWLQRALAGAELGNDKGATALLTILPRSDHVLKQYVGEARRWSTVTPVILPGYDDPDHLRRKLQAGGGAETQKRYLARLNARIEDLIRKAFRQAGYSNELIDRSELEWQQVGFRAGVDLASRYLPPQNLNNAPRIHVCVNFPSPVTGPIAIGSGRFRGFGLFARM